MSRQAAAAATKSLQFVAVATLITLPMIMGYTVLVYRVFWGRSADSSYDQGNLHVVPLWD